MPLFCNPPLTVMCNSYNEFKDKPTLQQQRKPNIYWPNPICQTLSWADYIHSMFHFVIIIFSCNTWGKWDSESLGDLPKTRQQLETLVCICRSPSTSPWLSSISKDPSWWLECKKELLSIEFNFVTKNIKITFRYISKQGHSQIQYI